MDSRVQRIIVEIESRYNEEICFDILAESFNLSLSRLRHLFKEETGVSLKTYLKQARLQQSKRLLETSFLSVKEIALRVGIKDCSHFVKNFEATFNLSPDRYRKDYLRKASVNLNFKHSDVNSCFRQ